MSAQGAPTADSFAADAMAALNARNAARAHKLAEAALQLEPEHARALMVQAIIARDAGRPADALPLIERAHASAPDDAEVMYHLAVTLHQSPARGPGARSRPRELYERAAALAPKSPLPRAMLAKLHEEMNDLPEARQAADEALALDPNNPTARLVSALVDRREGRLAEAREKFMAIIYGDSGRLLEHFPPAARAMIWNRHAHTLDALGEHDAAFAAFEYAQTLRWSLPDAKRVDASWVFGAADRALDAMNRDRLARWTRWEPGDGRPDPVFLVGFPRSGTTLTEQILAAHPGVVTLDEDSPLADVGGVLGPLMPDGPTGDALDNAATKNLLRAREAYFAGVSARLGDAAHGKLLIDKLPLAILELPMICRLFPSARIIVAIRDPRDVCLSAVMRLMVPNPAMANLTTLPKAAAFYEKVMDFWLTVRPNVRHAWIESRYEDLVSDPEPAVRRLVEFLGLPWDDAVLRHQDHVRGKAISTPSYEAVGSRITTRSVARWQQHRERIKPVLPTLAPFLHALGYVE
ncbi:MAG: sulfotransferase [Phycisphaerales bacterium]